jgi:hypothetical protein
MPYDHLLAALAKKQGQLMRLDTTTAETAPPGATVTDLYIEYPVPM